MTDGPTLEDLRKRASDLEIEGRSSMNRDELEQAIAAAEQEQAGDSVAVDTSLAPELDEPDPDEVGRPPLAEIAAERAANRDKTRRVIGTADDTQED